MVTFLSLPNELLQRVTSYLPFSSLLKLQCLNKRLHGICNDRLVLQDVAQHCFSNTTGAKESLLRMFAASSRTDLDASQLEWLEGISVLGNATTEEAKYLAYATQRCTEAVLAPASQKKWATRVSHWNSSFDVSEWLPQLLALHHPATLALEPDVFLYPLTEAQEKLLDKRLDIPFESISKPSTSSNVEEAEFINLHFTICYVTLQRLCNTRDSAETTRQFEEHFCPSSSHPDTDLGTAKSFNETIRLLCDRVIDYPNGGADFNQLQAFSWILPLALRLSVQFPAVGDYGSLPKPSKIPFYTFMDVKSLYPAGDSFSTCHIPFMTSPTFLTGKWMGSYTDERRRRGISQPTTRYDPLMRDIQIIAQVPSEHESDTQGISATIDSQTRGIDAHGPFILQGNIYSNGNVELAKLYIHHQWAWTWKGCITPFGIVGEWSGHGRYGGHFWIWKQDWR